MLYDELFEKHGVNTYYGKKSGSPNQKEFIVYTQDSNELDTIATEDIETRNTAITLRYYIKDTEVVTAVGRKKLFDRTNQIMYAMKAAGFLTSSGFSDVGDIEDMGFSTHVATFTFGQVMDYGFNEG